MGMTVATLRVLAVYIGRVRLLEAPPAMVVIGLAVVVAGVALIYVPASVILAGLLLTVIGIGRIRA